MIKAGAFEDYPGPSANDTFQLIGAAYFQAVGQATPALLLTLTRQGFFFIPLLFLLPIYFGVLGVWLAFPIAEVLATVVTVIFLTKEIRKNLIISS